MKKIVLTLAVVLMLLGCTQEVPARVQPEVTKPVVQEEVKPQEPVQEAKKDSPVKKTKCIMVWDAKQQKEVKKCRTLNIHQKHDGTQVPK